VPVVADVQAIDDLGDERNRDWMTAAGSGQHSRGWETHSTLGPERPGETTWEHFRGDGVTSGAQEIYDPGHDDLAALADLQVRVSAVAHQPVERYESAHGGIARRLNHAHNQH